MKNIKKSNITLLLIRNSFILLLLFFLTSCTGTGKTSLNRTELTTSSVNVFIVRDKAFIASGNLVTVSLNGTSLGKLGVGEYFSSPLINQSNILKVETTGLMGIGIGDDTRHFNKKSENIYFMVEYKTKLFSEGWKIVEITKNKFESKF